jgi:hypothetical protein
MAPRNSISPTTVILGADGHDWSWALVAFRPLAIPGACGYLAASEGIIWSAKGRGYRRGRPFRDWQPLNPSINQDGYPRVVISIRGKSRQWFVHRLVLEAFVGPCPPGMESCHINGRSDDDRLCNLRWGTPLENAEDKRRHGTNLHGESSPAAKATERQVVHVCELLQAGFTPWQVARQAGVGLNIVYGVRSRRYWTHVGERYHFPRLTEIPNRSCGPFNWRAVFTAEQVREIRRRRAAGDDPKSLAQEYGVKAVTIYRVLRRASYSNVP